MRRLPRWMIFTVVLVVLAVTGLSGLAVGTVRRSFPQLEGQLSLAGLSGPTEILRDSYGVAHIYADNAEDLFEAQGFVHAQDRFFEMDLRRHMTAGRLSELIGASQVETDTYLRTLGWRRAAEQELSMLSANTRRYLDAYASGVNAYLSSRAGADLSLEYGVLGMQGVRYTAADWTAVDSLAWLKAMAWDLSANLNSEIELALMTADVGEARAQELFPPFPLNGFDPILARGTVQNKRFDPDAATGNERPAPPGVSPAQLRAASPALHAVRGMDDVLRPWLQPDEGTASLGSNSWVVSGLRTGSGKPMLSNDQHLRTAIPSIYEQMGLHCRTRTRACPFDVSGFTFAGMPGVITGHTHGVAWGLTTSYVDVQDIFIEDVRGDDVRVGDRYVPLEVRSEEISVRGEDTPRTIRVRSSRHGPILSDVDTRLAQVGAGSPVAGGPFAVSLRWTGSTPSRTMDAIFELNAAASVDEARAAVERVAAPSQNMVLADTQGNIGYQLIGSVPMRGRGNGVVPSPGWDEAYDWRGIIAYAQLPSQVNPPSGYIVAANQQIIGRQYPYRLGSDYSYGWRSQELRDALRAAPPLTMDTGEALFYDDTSRFAADLVPLLLRIKVRDPWVLEGQRTLVGWDYSTSTDSAAAAFYNVVFYDILKATFRDEMPEELWPSGGDRWFAVVSNLLRQPSNVWWDDMTTKDKVEKRDDILLAAMTTARKELTSLMARDTDEWQWGRLHRVTLRHSTLGNSGVQAVERLFNRGDFAVPGGPSTVNAFGFNPNRGYRVTYAPVMRMLVDLSNFDNSRWVNQSGSSGHAYHPNYDDQTELWATNRTWGFVHSRAAVERSTVRRLELLPEG